MGRGEGEIFVCFAFNPVNSVAEVWVIEKLRHCPPKITLDGSMNFNRWSGQKQQYSIKFTLNTVCKFV